MGGIPASRRTLFTVAMLAVCLSSAVSNAGAWQQAIGPRMWTFPQDHGSHPEYRTEWWYFTGNLVGGAKARYGYQLTFFRQGVQFRPNNPQNSWSIRDLYLAHFATTDVPGKNFSSAERTSRAGPGLAGARTHGMDVWILSWFAKMDGSTIILEADAADMALSLRLTPRKPLVVHGENGLSKKGPGQGQASYYCSFTDLETRGVLKTSRRSPRVEVTGISWFDHEFGSNQLTPGQAGWDWFSLHLSDGRDLMIYFLRRRDGSVEAASSGTLMESTGASRHLMLPEIQIAVSDRWESPRSGASYPSRWRISVPSAAIQLDLAPLLADQELVTEGSTRIAYWEGAVAGRGISRGHRVTCEGYVELTGYAGSLGGIF